MSTTILSEAEWSVAGNEYDESIARCDETYQLRQRVGQLVEYESCSAGG